MTVQGPITFQDVAASFTEQQWMRLEDWQKEIYKTVVKEIHEAVISLGYTIINPNVVFSVKKLDESFVRVDDQSVEKKASVGDLPDILLKVKYEPQGDAPPVMEKQQDVAQSGSSVTSASLVNVGEKHVTHVQTQASYEPKKSNAFPVKTEEEAYLIHEYNSGGGDDEPCPAEGDDIIKHEYEEDADMEKDFQGVKQELDQVNDDIQQVKLTGELIADYDDGDKPSGEHSPSMEIGPKKRKTGCQVRGDILSVQERETRRLRVLEGMGKPYQALASFVYDPITFKSGKDREEIPQAPYVRRDVSNTRWCKCGHCCVMSSVEESVCCHEIFGLLSQLNDERLCITKHPAFQELCLDRDRLDFLYRFLAKIKRKNDVLYYLHKLRRTSYRAFVIWAYGFLDFRKYKPVPACVVKHVREFLPYPEELNVGYKKMFDYPAAIMALDHI
ncbi:zinc finger protein 777-like isoform X1 [Bufo gargarizans]|uniref:zinc finger protein 777-like isoform X1 n=2 Tax=Bufo gargarizans TaxID=30331 RepID=UPI001CF5E69D|nr:zinc finger protein 777-like isoform X1 [Bufo gargarizans]XP_044134225.1 zinc finger protein 777-like isoform X1 [Bufo gargarizans]XP_044134226.1 zinc finger protein 777-like isoform X1 [Bufo gargarizans]XP_044134227.1 zinc finger protein 777-like isoform X1 [Bufo gargarizans]XP_044134228.1 zinc finger protein 777-like isoform X1 [Bufo gargarizans]XP_044134229.1 zinc finger protein 777-like isoform X1 [Bufo gargarizans]